MKAKPQKKNHISLWDAIVIGVLLVFVFVSFYLFVRDNRARILAQNDNFIQAATRQKADRLDDLVDTAMMDAQAMAHLYGQTLTEPKVEPDMLEDITARTNFDYAEFIDKNGMDLTADGNSVDLSDRDYFQDGMKGNSAQFILYHSRVTDETLLISYAPFYYEDEIISVLSCIMKESTVMDVLGANYLGVQGDTYLLDREGRILFTTSAGTPGVDLIQSMARGGYINSETMRAFKSVLSTDNDIDEVSINYEGTSGAGNAYITTLHDGRWVLMQTLSSTATTAMAQEANSIVFRLAISLVAAFLVYVIYLVVKNWLQRRRLEEEKQAVTQIVDAVTSLFGRFILVDYEKDTYEYLKQDDVLDIRDKGSFTKLMAHLSPMYVEDGERMTAFVSPDYVKEHLTEDVPYLQTEYQLDAGGGRRWENLSILCLRREDGVPVGVLYAIQDVTVLKERELEIRAAMQEASDAAQAANRAKSDFLARMSHDIRTPMNAIMGMTAVAAMHLNEPERLKDCLNKITIASRHLLALINDVLDMSKIESGKATLDEAPFAVPDMVRSVQTIIQPQADKKDQQLEVITEALEHPAVVGDAPRIQQVLVNILGNAVKFTPEGGHIIFSVRELSSTVHGMGCYQFVCRDNGMGMDEQFLKTIFEPFSRADNSATRNIEGTGLGMSITRSIVQMMEGDIRVESAPGQGSTFTVEIHLKLQDSGRQAAPAGEEPALGEDLSEPSFEGKRVLLVEDNELNREIAEELLTAMGVTVEQAEDGKQALDMVSQAPLHYYDLVLMDVQMPVMNGYEAARAIRALDRPDAGELPMVAMTANAFATDIRAALDAGMNGHLAKPVEVAKLAQTLKRWL